MKFYVAGIKLCEIMRHDLRLATVIDLIPTIVREAEKSLGSDAVTIIVLHEHALTEEAISSDKKDELLAQLQAAIKPYRNIILVPGTLATYEALSNLSKKRERIWNNYVTLRINTDLKYDQEFLSEGENTFSLLTKPNPNTVCMQNNAYLITSDPIVKNGQQKKYIKHKKSVPVDERFKLPREYQLYSFFYPGAGNPIKKISIAQTELDLALIICAEHRYIHKQHYQIANQYPAIEIIVSNSITLNPNHLFGALNIYIDSQSKDSTWGFQVLVNQDHPKASMFKEIKCKLYYAYGIQDFIGLDRNVTSYSHAKSSLRLG